MFHKQALQLHKNKICLILVLEVVKEGILWFPVASEKKSDADQESLLKNIIIINIL